MAEAGSVLCCSDPICAKVLQSSDRAVLETSNSVYCFHCQAEGCCHENMLLHFKIKTRTRRWCDCWCQVGAAYRFVMISQLNLCSQVISAVQHGPEGQLACAARPKTVPTQISCWKDYELLNVQVFWFSPLLFTHVLGRTLKTQDLLEASVHHGESLGWLTQTWMSNF